MLYPGFIALLIVAADGGSPSPPRLRTSDGSDAAGKKVLLLKGRSLAVAYDRPAAWSSLPAGVVEIKDIGDGKATVTALMDAFDDPNGAEPLATVRACDGDACTSFQVTSLVDTSGQWHLVLTGTWLGIVPHEEERAPLFVQSGRDVAFEDKPPKDAKPPFNIIRLRLYGRNLQIVDGGGSLKKFSGKLKDRSSGTGTFDSVPGFSGTWKATRSP